jgi:hypothetical protein
MLYYMQCSKCSFFCTQYTDCMLRLPYLSLILLVISPVAPVVTGVIIFFMFHIRFISSTHKLLYFNLDMCYSVHFL